MKLNLLSVTLLAIALFIATFAVNIQTPLYAVYATNSHVSATAMTLAFAAYIAGLMPTLFFLGGLSDRIGRRIPITIALIFGATAAALLILEPIWESLIVARVLLGIGTGLVTTASTAYMTEMMGKNNSRRATLTVTSASSLGFGGGALATSLSLIFQGPTIAPISFIILIVSALFLAVIVLTLPRVDTPQQVTLLRLPVFPAGTWVFGIAMALAWSTTGMIISIIPLELETQGLSHWTGLAVFLAIFIGFLCQPIARRMTNEKSLALGFLLIPFGFFVLLLGLWVNSIFLILLGISITSAASYGFTYLAGLNEVSQKAPNNYARVSAGLFVYAYAGFSLPVIASGALADIFGVLTAMTIFLIIQIILTFVTIIYWKKSYFLKKPVLIE